MPKSPISRIGGKYYLASKIIPLFPEHKRYIEPFGGAMHILFRKEPAPTEIYNDIDSSLVNFFMVVKNKPEELFEQLDLALYSREVFLNALETMDEGTDVERASKFYIVNRQCFGGKMKNWSIDTDGKPTFFNYERRIREAHERLKHVYIENLDWRDIFKKYDSPDTLMLIDPPYTFNGHRSDDIMYRHEMSIRDHHSLVGALKALRGKFILCGYANDMYDCFKRMPIGESYMCVNKKVGEPRIKKQEFIWVNF